VSDLHARSFINFLPGQSPSDLTIDELVELVRRTVRGPRHWSPSRKDPVSLGPLQRIWRSLGDRAAPYIPIASSFPRLPHKGTFQRCAMSRKPSTIHQVILNRDTRSDLECDVQLIPGGQYLLFREKSLLECWSLVEKRVVWRYQRDSNDSSKAWLTFAYEVVEEGRAVVIIAITINAGYSE